MNKKHTYRTILIWAVIAFAFIQIWPTLGWMLLSPEARQARIDRWSQEDEEYRPPSYFRDLAKSIRRWAQFDNSKVINLGLDLQGGVHMVIGIELTDEQKAEIRENLEAQGEFTEAEFKKRCDYKLEEMQDQVHQNIVRRITEFEAKEPIIQKLGKTQIQIQLPGQKDIKRAKNLITKTAYLTFHIVAGPNETEQVLAAVDKHFNGRLKPFIINDSTPSIAGRIAPENFAAVKKMIDEANNNPSLVPEDKKFAFSKKPNPWDKNQNYALYLLTREPGMTGEGLTGARAMPNNEMGGGQWEILFSLDSASGKKFGDLTGNHVGEPLAIVLDGVVESAPNISTKITTSGRITGSFDGQQARDLTIALRSGSLPVPIREEYTGVVGASLGKDSVRKGVMSSVVGIVLVAVFMLLYYRFSGLVANVALFLNAVILLAVLAYFNGTLTLPGIAGLILTVGMAVDANVLIFERIREELRNGRSLAAAIEAGYSRATVTILDANVTTLIAAVVLLQFGTGPIQGFGVTLAIGICSSVFTALVVTRAIFDWLVAKDKLSKLTMNSFIKEKTEIQFMSKRHGALILSAAVIIIGFVSFGARQAGVYGQNNFGVDFTEGTNMILAMPSQEKIQEGDIRATLEDAGFKEPVVQVYKGGDEAHGQQFVLRIGETAGTDAGTGESITVSSKVVDALSKYSNNIEVIKEETVGPAVGKQLRRDAYRAIFYALLFIILYIWFRFELKFAIGAVAALVHDVLITVGLFALLGRQLTMPVVAALLTIIGYSLNDTIVVFDRVREDLRLYRSRGMSYLEIMNLSINQTLSRTLLTSLTTLFVVVVLAVFGGDAIRDFALALCFGVVVGTYSSIFIASPVVNAWQKMWGRHAVHATPDGTSRRNKKNS